MNRPSLQTIAKRLQDSVGGLDSFLVPFVNGNVDSHGKKIHGDKEAASQIAEKATGLKDEIEKALRELVYHL